MIRPAQPTDAGRVGTILSAFIDETDWMPRIHTHAEDLSFAGMMIDRGWVSVGMPLNRIDGFLAREGQVVHALYVDRHARRAGLGTALLNHAKAQSDRLELWTFQANTPAQAFYRQQGFQEIARTDGAGNDEGLPDIQLAWRRGEA